MSSESYHEPIELLSDKTKNLHRAIISLREELEAIDWYQQRAEACTDEELRSVLLHNKNEEIEHAMMTLEWLRRNDPAFAANVATYLNAQGPITEIEKGEKSEKKDGGEQPSAGGSLGIGSLRGVK
jgi:ferritin-like protein